MAAKILATDPIQAQLIQARRSQILDAATQVFAEKGYQRATIRDVAQAAGIADGTIYNYFDNKTALLFGLLDQLNETEQREIDFSQVDMTHWREFWRSHMRQRLSVIGRTELPNFQVLFAEVMSNPEIREQFMKQIIEPTFVLAEPFFQHLTSEGKIKPTNLPLAMRIFTAGLLGLIMLRVMGEPLVQAEWDALPDLMTTIFLDGIAAAQGDES